MVNKILKMDDYKLIEINHKEELDKYLASYPKDTVYKMRVNYETGSFKIKVKRLGSQPPVTTSKE